MRKEEKNGSAQVAAFFDLDGTLMPLPSLEQRFFRIVRYRREIPLKNYLLWLSEAVRLLPRGISAVTHANKMYLRGVHRLQKNGTEDRHDCAGSASGRHSEGQASTPPRRNSRWPVPRFFDEGMERVAWHAGQAHAIVIVTGTLEPLANAAAYALEMELAARGFAAKILTRATKLEESDGKWTGRILGEAMFGEAKARAIRKLAREKQLDLSHCWAYGDDAQDRWMLAAVGHPAAVNPSVKLEPIARKRNWPVLHWDEEINPVQRTKSAERVQRRERKSAGCRLLASALQAERIEPCTGSSRAIKVASRSLE